MVASSALARNSQVSPSRSTEITMPSGQSAWTFNSACAIAINSASVFSGLLMLRRPPGQAVCLQVAGLTRICRGDEGTARHLVALNGAGSRDGAQQRARAASAQPERQGL